MARPKRPPNPMLRVARAHLRSIAPGLAEAPLRLHTLDGPPGSPRYAVSVVTCQRSGPCPYDVVDENNCPVRECALRHSLRMLLSREGEVVEVIRDGLRWDG